MPLGQLHLTEKKVKIKGLASFAASVLIVNLIKFLGKVKAEAEGFHLT